MNTRHIPPPRTVGIDLASQPARTAVCVIEWSSTVGQIVDLDCGVLDDDRLLELIRDERVSRVGIDAPFGFPVPFAEALLAYQLTGEWPPLPPEELRFRATEVALRGTSAATPLSAVTDRLIWPALRCASLLSRAADGAVQRVGGRVVEVYPGAALRRWLGDVVGSAAGSYKGDKPGRSERREEVISALIDAAGGTLEIDAGVRARCVASDDQLDALAGGLVARACDLGLVDEIPRGSQWLALREGWIVMPKADALGMLV